MNFCDEDELDFEEDLFENGETEDKEEAQGSEVDSFDHYLQIDCSEDEEDLLSKIPPETEQVENSVQDTEVTDKDKEPINEESEKPEQTEPPKQVDPNQSFFSADNQKKNFVKKNVKQRNFNPPLLSNPGFTCPKRWRPYNNFRRITRQNMGQRANHLRGLPLRYPNHLHHFSQNYLQNQNEFVSLLGLRAAKNKNMQKMAFTQGSNSVIDVGKNFVGNAIMGQCNNTIINQFQFNDISRFKGIIAQKLADGVNNQNFPPRCITNGLQPNINGGSFNEEAEKMKGIPVLADGEKEFVKSKKEARLMRFKNDQTGKMEKSENTTEKPTNENLHLEDEYFKKMEEQKRKREEIFNLKEKPKQDHNEGTPEKVAINKELLLRKENPFESFKLKVSVVRPQVKIEKNEDVEESGSSLPEIKKEAKSPVKFIRTISKSFEELGLSKTTHQSDRDSDWNSIFENVPKGQLVDAASQTQAEPHLTGCIVKVFNVPPSTTPNEILGLCNSIGIVREVKFNFPLENSVAIRFSDSKSAEIFFHLYHGRVVKNHTLTVVTV